MKDQQTIKDKAWIESNWWFRLIKVAYFGSLIIYIFSVLATVYAVRPHEDEYGHVNPDKSLLICDNGKVYTFKSVGLDTASIDERDNAKYNRYCTLGKILSSDKRNELANTIITMVNQKSSSEEVDKAINDFFSKNGDDIALYSVTSTKASLIDFHPIHLYPNTIDAQFRTQSYSEAGSWRDVLEAAMGGLLFGWLLFWGGAWIFFYVFLDKK